MSETRPSLLSVSLRVPPCFDVLWHLAPCPGLTDAHSPCSTPSLEYASSSRLSFPLPFFPSLLLPTSTLSVSCFSFDVILSLTFILSFNSRRDSPLILSRLSTHTHSLQSTVALRSTHTTLPAIQSCQLLQSSRSIQLSFRLTTCCLGQPIH